MKDQRIHQHPVLDIPEKKAVHFSWNEENLVGHQGEMISSALFANDIKVFGRHHRDNSPQGMYCANGQCSQCMVIADGLPVKSCMTAVKEGMRIQSIEGLPRLPALDVPVDPKSIPSRRVEVLIIGGGPAGLSAAIELGKLNIDTLLVDDKDRLGGKLVLQTHKFFGSVEDSYAGTRGYTIGAILEKRLKETETVNVWVNTTAVGVFSDGIVGVVKEKEYRRIQPERLLIATGAREKMLPFPGNTLPGIYGAGAFQTLVNRDLIKASERVLIVGGGNVGLIAGYHAIQAGIEVVALIEALPEAGGYQVHADKLIRLGVPVFTGHTIVSANGKEKVTSATIAALDKNGDIVPGTHQTFQVDTVLIAVGLDEVNEFYLKARAWGMDVYSAGDAREIAEASAAMFAGKIEGLKIAKAAGRYSAEIPKEWDEKAEILKAKPGRPVKRELRAVETGVGPQFFCNQEIPCNPCTSVCPEGIIRTEDDGITGLPEVTDSEKCKGCMACVAVCPGLAVSLIDFRKDADCPEVTLPYEIWQEKVASGQMVTITDMDGETLGTYPVERVITNRKKFPGTRLVQVKLAKEIAKRAIGIRIQENPVERISMPMPKVIPDEAMICRCERVTAGEIRTTIKDGVRDVNQLKARCRVGMGACGSKTCRPLIGRIFKDEGIDLKAVTDRVDRPLFVEVPLGILAGLEEGEGNE